MFSKTLVASTVLALAASTVATMPASQCNTGGLQCCNSVQTTETSSLSLLAGLVGAVLGPTSFPVGVTCTPITVIGAGGNSCTQQPVCCTGNNFNGVIVLGCTPVNLNL